MKRRHPHPILNRMKPKTPSLRTRISQVVEYIPVIKARTIKKKINKYKNLYSKVEIIIVNYKTPKLLKQCVESLFHHYPGIGVVLVDNGSGDGSVPYAYGLTQLHGNVRFIKHSANLGHGLAMHDAIDIIHTPFVFTLDTDTIVEQAGFLEKMLAAMASDTDLYAIGWRRFVDRFSGVPIEWHLDNPNKDKFVAYIHPYAAMYRRSMYLQLPGFEYHGAPCLQNMLAAEKAKYKVKNFPVKDYIKHLVAGTRRMWDGQWDIKDKPKVREWQANVNFPL
jgi:glycosyltransferase involved in cell wall biosynthesis